METDELDYEELSRLIEEEMKWEYVQMMREERTWITDSTKSHVTLNYR
jgi:hypothetical protein